MKYEHLPKASKEEALSRLATTQGEELCLLLLGISEIDDWKWVQDIYLKYLGSQDTWVAASAITGLGHLARVSSGFEKEKVVNALCEVKANRPELEGEVSDALSDIEMFT